MIKKLFPIFFIFFIWLVFAKPFFLENKIPYPSDFQVNHFSLWSVYPALWGPVKNPAQPDVVSQIYPWKHFTIESLKEGNIPLWNPYSFSGTPHLANYQSAVFSPTNFLFFIFDFPHAWGLAVLLPSLFAGIFMYAFIRSLKLSQAAGIISAISFMFCGFITVWLSYTTLSLAICFLPLALFSIESYSVFQKNIFLFLLFISIPLSFLSGHFQISLYFMFFVISYIFFKLYETKNKKDFLNLLSFSFLGLLFSSIQLVPSIELYFQAVRSSIFQKIDALPIRQLSTIVAPDFYGNPVTRNNLFGSYAEWSVFSGTVPFFLAIYSLFKKERKLFFFSLMGLVSLILCLNTPILDVFVKLKIPVLSTAALSRILVLFSFSIAVLSAFGFEKLILDIQKRKIKNLLIWLIFSSIIFAFLWLLVFGKLIDARFFQTARNNLVLPSMLFVGLSFAVLIGLINKKLIKLTILIVVMLTSFEMLRFATKWQVFSSYDFVFPQTPIVSKLVNQDNLYRTYARFGAEGSVYYHIPGVEGYDPLYIGRYGELIGSLDDGRIKPPGRVGVTLPTNATLTPKTIDLLGIKYIAQKTMDRSTVWGFPIKKYPNKLDLVFRDKDYFIYENKDVFPRAFVIGNYEVIQDNQEIIDRILGPNFDLRKNVILEKDPGISPVASFDGDAKILNYSPNNINMQTSSNDDSLLIISDNFYPGWHARVNGAPVEILRADYTFRAIPVPKGEAVVEIYYGPDSFHLGFLLSLFSAVAVVILLTGKWYTKKKKIHK